MAYRHHARTLIGVNYTLFIGDEIADGGVEDVQNKVKLHAFHFHGRVGDKRDYEYQRNAEQHYYAGYYEIYLFVKGQIRPYFALVARAYRFVQKVNYRGGKPEFCQRQEGNNRGVQADKPQILGV